MSPYPSLPHQCRPYFKLRSQVTKITRLVPSAATAVSWDVPGLCKAYKWPTGLAGGGKIAIVELGGGWVQSDIDSYFQSIGQPSPRVTDVSVDGTRNTPGQSGSAGDADFE